MLALLQSQYLELEFRIGSGGAGPGRSRYWSISSVSSVPSVLSCSVRLAVIPSCILHSATRLPIAILPTPYPYPLPRITYLLLLHLVSPIQPSTQRATLSSAHTSSNTPTHTHKSTLTDLHTVLHIRPRSHHAHAPARRPAIYGTTPNPTTWTSNRSIAEVLYPPHPYAPHASSIIRRRRGHGSIAVLTPRRQADNDEG